MQQQMEAQQEPQQQEKAQQQQEPQQQEEAQHQPQATASTIMSQDERALPEECHVCFCGYEEQQQRPRTLPCGHTLCSPCIATLLSDARLTCPTCLAVHMAKEATHFPVNYALENMIRRFRTLQTNEMAVATAGKSKQNGETGVGRKLQSVIQDQRESLQQLGGSLQVELSQLEQYRVRLSLCLARHGCLLEQLDKVTQQHRKAMTLLSEEDLRVLAFMHEGEKDRGELQTAQDQLDVITAAQLAFPVLEAADASAAAVQEWLKHSKEQFPSGAAYTASRRMLESTEAALLVVLEEEDAAEAVTSGHAYCTILDVLDNVTERSIKHVKQRIKRKFMKTVESVEAAPVKTEENASLLKTIGELSKTQSPSGFTFKCGFFDSQTETQSPKLEASTPPSFTTARRHLTSDRHTTNTIKNTTQPDVTTATTCPFGTPTTTTTTAPSSLFGTPTTTTTSSFGGTPTITSATASSSDGTPTTNAPSSIFGGTTTATPSFGGTTTTTAIPSFFAPLKKW